MSLTDAALQNLIIAEVGDVIVPPAVQGVLQLNIATMWQKNGIYRGVPDLQFLMTKREAVQTVIGALRTIDVGVRTQTGDFMEDDTGQISALERLSGDLGAQIIERQKQFAQSAGGAVGSLQATVMQPPPAFQTPSPYAGYIDANDAGYRGDTYRRSGTWWR